MCGEYVPTRLQWLRRRAVHPHVCGEYGWQSVRFDLPLRFIPTCVGNTVEFAVDGSGRTVHPHVCGEYSLSARRRNGVLRFIPTCVGNTSSAHLYFTPKAVHPHVCGEYVISNLRLPAAARFIPTCVGNTARRLFRICGAGGSSPRVWGIHLRCFPAHPQSSVHPHVCGEYASACFITHLHTRFIPTCVGNTLILT